MLMAASCCYSIDDVIAPDGISDSHLSGGPIMHHAFIFAATRHDPASCSSDHTNTISIPINCRPDSHCVPLQRGITARVPTA